MQAKQNNETVSAIITTYGRPWSGLSRSVASVLRQESPVLELLIMDDNPEGSSLRQEIQTGVQALSKESLIPVRYCPNERNLGVGGARNRGARLAKGMYIAFLDDDDEWLPDKTGKQLKMFRQMPEAALTFGMGLKFLEGSEEPSYTWAKSVFKEHPSYVDMLFADRVGSASHPMIRRDAFLALGGFNETRGIAVEDYEFWIRLSREYKLRGTQDVLYHKHMEPGEHVSTGRRPVYLGYRRIYKEFKESYQRNPAARQQILRNITRTGVKGFHVSVLPYALMWVATYLHRGNSGK